MSKWSIPLDKLAERVKLDMETVVRKATLQVFQSVIELSPVDTGRFRANWNVSYAMPDKTVTGDDWTRAAADARAKGETTKATTLPVGGIVYMTNSLPYALRLENGWSDQAPTGMVRKSTVQFARFVRKAIR